MIWLWLVGSALAGCDLASLRAAVDEAEVAFAELDLDGFSTAVTHAEYTLACLDDGVTPVDAAAYHRLKALKAFVDGRSADSTLAFTAVLATQPGYTLPTSLAPDGHPLRTAFEQARELADPGTFELPAPATGWVQVDGRRTSSAPAGRPWVFQKLEVDGGIETSAWVPSGGRWPDYPGPVYEPTPSVAETPGDTSGVPASPPATPRASPVQRGLRGTGIGLGVASLLVYGGAFAARNQYDGAVYDGDEERIRKLHGVTNGLTVGAISGAGLSLTFLVTGYL